MLGAVFNLLLKWSHFILITYQRRSGCISWNSLGWKLQSPSSNWLHTRGNGVTHRGGKRAQIALGRAVFRNYTQVSGVPLSLSLPLLIWLLFLWGPLSLCGWTFSRGSRGRRCENHNCQRLQAPVIPPGDSGGKRERSLSIHTYNPKSPAHSPPYHGFVQSGPFTPPAYIGWGLWWIILSELCVLGSRM